MARTAFKSRVRPVNICDCHGAIERNHRRIIKFHQSIVERENPRPIGRLIIDCSRVTRGDPRLKMIFANLATRSRFVQARHATRDHRLIPARPVLFFESKQVALIIFTRRGAGGIQQHQRQQCMRLWLISSAMLCQ